MPEPADQNPPSGLELAPGVTREELDSKTGVKVH